ncbi:SPP1 [Symbiodinium sp. CCMP2456]|nr:SPP1 [Symbiodinium sp. CCMP2456]
MPGCPKGESTWRDFPFKDVPGKPSVKQLQIEADGVEFVICDLKKQSWDNPPDWYGKKNYLIAESGQYSLRHGHLRRIRESKVMVVTDLDHTLVGHERDPENKLLEEFRNLWLGEYALNGSALAYSTGRSKSMALDVAQERQLIRPDLLICGVGTEVYTVPSRLPILGWWEERDSLELMPEWKSKMLNGFNRATVEELLTSRFQKFELRGTPVDDPYRIPTAYQMDEAFDDSKKLLQEALGSSYQVISSGHGEWKLIDICSAEAGKLKAMQFAMSTLKFEPAKTLACGDSGNDELMFRNSGGRGVMVANALPELVEAMTAAADPPTKELRRGAEFKTCHGSTMLFAGREVAGGIVEALQYFFP